ncbi:hypothetical protein AVEN_130403-1 [Araneus ventricosus]|uniref:Uncharacterized protein n=1 Tax=Araneus ventricosus TaxID=182803 RepID=A0A4Y2BDD5_ARAVE|nr:hypothetical protein AVEN_130403-1 [Araneus ventricosus]
MPQSHATESSPQHEARNEASRVRIKELRQSLSYSDRNEKRDNDGLRMQMNRLSQLVKLDRIAFQYNSETEYGLHPVLVAESLNIVCTNCKALKFKNEAPGMCCLNDKVKLPPLKAPLEPLFSLIAGSKKRKKKVREEEERKLQQEERRFQEQRQHELELARLQSQTLTACQSETQPFVQEASGIKKKFHLPKLEFRQFSGNVEDWVPFWSQFEHIHKDSHIALENKFQYLVQATVSGSRTREVVESFPPTGANYEKAIESLKARFDKEDLLVGVYVRELLKLIISVQENENFSMTSLCDKLESYLRALETLGVTTDKCASILYPMVESCFPEEFLRA